MAGRRVRLDYYHGSVALAVTLAIAVTLLVLLGPSLTWPHLVGLWLIGVNVTAFGYYGHDKQCARLGRLRVPEVVLHGLAVAGGSRGAYAGMRFFRHKTIKGTFQIFFWFIIVLQVVLIVVILYRVIRG